MTGRCGAVEAGDGLSRHSNIWASDDVTRRLYYDVDIIK
jgi:hypothetical protein